MTAIDVVMLYYVACALLGIALSLYCLNRWARQVMTLSEKSRNCKHPPTPVAVYGQPGKECQKCGYYIQISSREFKQLFGISFNRMSRTLGRTAVG